MNGIDTAITSLLASRVDSLLNIAPGNTATSQTGATGVDTGTTTTPAAPPAPPPTSTQTALSAVALTLNAIVLSGGDATPAIVGQLPIWPASPALDIEIGELPLFDEALAGGTAGNPNAAAANANPAANATAPSAATAANGTTATGGANLNPNAAATVTNVAAALVPVAALAAALEQTVAESGMFYESHLAQWLAGQLSPADLANEAQNKLLSDAAQLPLDWASDADDATPSQSSASNGAQRQGAPANNAPDGGTAARAQSPIESVQAARFAAAEVLANSLSELNGNGQPARAGLHGTGAQPAEESEESTQAAQTMAAVHPATVPLVRQQLDMLATGQFRWTGEAWPGARLDWTIQQDGDEWDRSGGGADSEDDQPWRTRLTLSLRGLGTVDADLTLTGNRLVVRVQASPGGAARLVAQGEGFRSRLAAAGIELSGLSIREIGGGVPSAVHSPGAAAAQQAAASAYARSASAGESTSVKISRRITRAEDIDTGPRDDFDWEMR